MKQCMMLILAMGVLVGCATTGATKFERLDGAYEGIIFVKYDLPVFFGEVPVEFPYKNLGQVEGRCLPESILGKLVFRKALIVQLVEAQQDCIAQAKALGANALIDKGQTGSFLGDDFRKIAKAINFDKVPTKEEIEAYKQSQKQKNK